ncbi:WD40 repeat domain-containing protein, partial [Sphaerisporangium flaviroseum]|uniref:WD40 repeat domain-containing protein n=1 Tax=Sphaerisporangium flaviroseum TaxID=509199 RepID=UPI003CD0667D
TVRLWDAATRQPIGKPLTGHIGPVLSVVFSPDARRLATGSTDNTVRLWDAATHQPIGQPEPFSGNGIAQVAFSPDGRSIVTVGNSPADKPSTLRLLNLPGSTTVTELLNTICIRADRDLTPAEWAYYVPDLPYQRTCPD